MGIKNSNSPRKVKGRWMVMTDQLDRQYDEPAAMRRCKRCGETKQWDPSDEAKGGQWYRRSRVRVIERFDGVTVRPRAFMPSPYCRDCSNMINAGYQAGRRAIERIGETDPDLAAGLAADNMGPCASCGVRSRGRRPVVGTRDALCDLCAQAVEGCGWDVEKARANWLVLFLHISDEATKTSEWNDRQGDDRKRKAHKDVDNPPFFHHATCIMWERQWKAVMRWLQNRTVNATPPQAY
jgi:hypothetical protein